MPVYAFQQAVPEIENDELWEQRQKQIEEEVDACEGAASHHRKKLKKFLVESDIMDITEMDYPLRLQYEAFLNSHIYKNNVGGYLKLYDLVKRNVLERQWQTLAGRQEIQWKYRNEILFLRYHPDPEIAKTFEDTRQQEILVWDFTHKCPEKMKQQIFLTLTEFIETMRDPSAYRRVRLLSLKYFYDYCVRHQIEDIELIEQEQIEAYFTHLHIKEKQSPVYEAILNLSRKIAFMHETEIRWDANVWYLERFHLPESRYNRSKSLESISFLEIRNRQNRKCAQQYMKYELGVNGQALSTVTIRYTFVRNFIVWMGEQDICQCTAEQMDAYIKNLQERGLQASSFNEQIVGIRHFFKFLEVRKFVKRSPLRAEYYLQKAIPVHHDRSVEYEVYMEIMEKLPTFPEQLRCMFLHLWCLGLRASEVCTLKGNAYYRQEREPWMQIYQVKMKIYKRIPIPEALYRIMKVYLKKYAIGPDDYIFQNRKGGPCQYQTFRHRMIERCAENGIQNGAYIFKSHDYRHTVATMFYDNEVSIQSIRDYLGHHYEEMTRQYIDYMPQKLAEANEEYFNAPENNLASCLKKGGKYGNPKDLL